MHTNRANKLRRSLRWLCAVLVALLSTGLMAGCGGGGGGGSTPSTFVGGSGSGSGGDPVGTRTCEQCHTSTIVAGTGILAVGETGQGPLFAASVHNSEGNTRQIANAPTCETCHGNGSQHFGVGPIPNPVVGFETCRSCHQDDTRISMSAFLQTKHANGDSLPDKFFFQGSVGTEQATYFGQPEFNSAGNAVSKNEHIEECSVCHATQNRADSIAGGLVADPAVGCASCHDAHNPADTVRNFVASRSATGETEVDISDGVNFRVFSVNNVAGQQQFGAQNVEAGTQIRPRMRFDFHKGGDATQTYAGYTKQLTTAASASDDYLRLTPERLCASCHAKGQYKYGRRYGSTAITETHQTNVYEQYRVSGHGDVSLGPWTRFSSWGSSNTSRPLFPYDLGGKVGQTMESIDGRLVSLTGNNTNYYWCFRCHNGVAAIDFMEGKVGGNIIGDTTEARVLWGNASVTCITCHDPHGDGIGTTKNVRSPKYVVYNEEFLPTRAPAGTGNVRGGTTKFEDLSAEPPRTNSTICLSCHQGRDSSWTAWNKMRRARVGRDGANAGNFPYTNGDDVVSLSRSAGNGNLNATTTITVADTSTMFVGELISTSVGALQSSTAVATVASSSSITLSKTAQLTGKVVLSFANGQFIYEGTVTQGSATVTGMTSTVGLVAGMTVTSSTSALQSSTAIASIVDGTTITVDKAANLSANAIALTVGGFSAVTDHYLAAGGLLFGRNSGEFLGKQYTRGIDGHVQKNCTGCHMSEPSADLSEGGHSWKPKLETCQECHPGLTGFYDKDASGDWDGDGVAEKVNQEIGTFTAIAANANGGNPVYGTGLGGTGLIGLLNEALYDSRALNGGVPLAYGARVNGNLRAVDKTNGNSSNADLSPNQQAAAASLAQLLRTAPHDALATEGPLFVHNPYYAAQILIDSLEALGKPQSPQLVNFSAVRPVKGTMTTGTDYRTVTP